MNKSLDRSNPFLSQIEVEGTVYCYVEIPETLARLPKSLKILKENATRISPGANDVFEAWLAHRGSAQVEIEFKPSRVLIHDMNCGPAIADFAALREAVAEFGGRPELVNPKIPVDIVVDHSTIVDHAGTAAAFKLNLIREFERNEERFRFIRWAQESLSNLRVVPPGTGILHQINIEHLTDVVRTEEFDGVQVLVPDTLVGTDSHTPMVNALGVVAWGVGGIEAQAAALGDTLTIPLPEVIGVRLLGKLRPGVNATDLALTMTQVLRKFGVVEKIVEFYGPGVAAISVADRAVVANMAPEYGAMCSFFPVDQHTLNYLRLVGHPAKRVSIVEAYAKKQGIWHDPAEAPVFTNTIDFDLASVETSISGPKRPQDRISLADVGPSFITSLSDLSANKTRELRTVPVPNKDYALSDGAVLIAAITSCTNTSNPGLMIAAGLIARNARRAGLTVPPWVKTSLSPGSPVVADYLGESGLQAELDALGFQITGFGCMTCCGNSGDLDEKIVELTSSQQIVGAAVLSGNRNFENRIHAQIRASYLCSPALVIAYALAGTVLSDLRIEVARSPDGHAVTLADLWPSDSEVAEIVSTIQRPVFERRFRNIFTGPEEWRRLDVKGSTFFEWDNHSSYIKRPPYFRGTTRDAPGLRDIGAARALVILGDSVTTDHISPVGSIEPGSLAGNYLRDRKVPERDYNQFGTRRGNHEVMMRGVFSNPRLQNEILRAEGIRGGMTRFVPTDEIMSVYDAAMAYAEQNTPLIIIAGKEYGTGSSRDWAAKGPQLVGVRAIVAESFERIHRINLIGTGIVPLVFVDGVTRADCAFDGSEIFDIIGLADMAGVRERAVLIVKRANGTTYTVPLIARVETLAELQHLRHGGMLRHVLRDILDTSQTVQAQSNVTVT